MLASQSGIRGLVHRFIDDERGATAIEYGLIAAGIFLAIFFSVVNVASSVNVMFDMIKDKVVSAIT